MGNYSSPSGERFWLLKLINTNSSNLCTNRRPKCWQVTPHIVSSCLTWSMLLQGCPQWWHPIYGQLAFSTPSVSTTQRQTFSVFPDSVNDRQHWFLVNTHLPMHRSLKENFFLCKSKLVILPTPSATSVEKERVWWLKISYPRARNSPWARRWWRGEGGLGRKKINHGFKQAGIFFF